MIHSVLIKLRKQIRFDDIILSSKQRAIAVSSPWTTLLLGNQRAMPSSSPVSDGHSDAVAVKFCLLFRTRDLYKSDLWQTTTVPPWLVLGATFPLALPIKVPIILETENFLVFWVACTDRHSFRIMSIEEYIEGLFSATETSQNWELFWTATVLPSISSTCNKKIKLH